MCRIGLGRGRQEVQNLPLWKDDQAFALGRCRADRGAQLLQLPRGLRARGKHAGGSRDGIGLDRGVLPEPAREGEEDERADGPPQRPGEAAALLRAAPPADRDVQQAGRADEGEKKRRTDVGGVANVKQPAVAEDEPEKTARRQRRCR